MLHLDLRDQTGQAVWWVRTGKQHYHYPARGGIDAATFYTALQELTV